jgi:hypothetical protein
VSHGGHELENAGSASLNAIALRATRHCLTGCAIGEIAATVTGGALALSTTTTVVLGIVLAFLFGYSLTIAPLLRTPIPLGQALGIAFAADTVSIVVMEVVDNLFVLVVPGAMNAGVTDPLFWGSLIVGLAIAFVVAFPVNRWLIARGRGHAVVHGAAHH